MPLNAALLLQRKFPSLVQTYGPVDASLYALGLGLGLAPSLPADLAHVVEDSSGHVETIPSMVCVLPFPPPWAADPTIDADWRRVVHVEQRVDFHAPLPAAATVRAEARVDRVIDKGPGKGALVQSTRTVKDATSGQPMADVTMLSLARVDGGCGHAERPGAVQMSELPDAPARSARFEKPILHGRCTFGMATHRLIQHMLNGALSQLASIGCRFTDMVYPGESLRLECWRKPQGIPFRLSIPARQTVALSRGFAALRA